MTLVLRGLGLAVLAVIAVVWYVSPGRAAERWVAQMEEEEGGPAMVASITGEGAGDYPPMIRMMCGGDPQVSLRYLLASDSELTPVPGDEADFLFENEHDQLTVHMLYEDLDGAFAAYFAKSDPLVTLLKTGSDLIITPDLPDAAAQTFPLQGSTKAIDKLFASCP